MIHCVTREDGSTAVVIFTANPNGGMDQSEFIVPPGEDLEEYIASRQIFMDDVKRALIEELRLGAIKLADYIEGSKE